MRNGQKSLLALSLSLMLISSCGQTSTVSSAAAGGSNLAASSSSINAASSSEETTAEKFAAADQGVPEYVTKANTRGKLLSEDTNFGKNYYHIFMHSFADGNQDGIGDLKGIINKFDYLKDSKDGNFGAGSLGVDGILLSPIFQATSYHKYDVIDYEKVDSQFGSLEDFDKLVSLAHSRSVKVFLDIPLNHVSPQNELFKKAAEAIVTTDEADENGRPTAAFVASHPEVDYFRFIKQNYSFSGYSNRKYFLDNHWFFEGFSEGMPDWNLDNQAVRDLQAKYLKFWVDRGIDGFRLDAVQSYYGEETIDLAKNYEYINYVEDELKAEKSDIYIVGEGPWSSAACLPYMNNTKINSYFDFDTSVQLLPTSRMYYLAGLKNQNLALEDLQDFLKLSKLKTTNANYTNAFFNSNHDVGRIANQFIPMGDDTEFKLAAYKMHLGLQNLFKGNYFMYYGEETGLTGTKRGTDDMPCRSPFRWEDGDKANTTPLESGLSDVSAKYFPTADVQRLDSNSLFNYCRRLFKVKYENPFLSQSDLASCYQDDAQKVYVLTDEGKDGFAAINYSSSSSAFVACSLIDSSINTLRGCLTTDGSYAELNGGNVSLPPMSITILK
jgi:alpha-amylase